jgi:segregation and condensation protein A
MEKEYHDSEHEVQSMSNSQKSIERIGHYTNQENSLVSNFQKNPEKVSQEQIHDLLFNDKLSWQAIIYDLINTEQLNPWDIDLSILAQKYLVKVRELEEDNFFISSKVLLAASLLLRFKSEIILNQDLPGLDDILYGKKEEKKYFQERIELDEDIPELVPRTPLPRFKKVTLKELMSALGDAIKTENRRINREIVFKQREIEANIALPRNSINIRDKIKEIYSKLREIFKSRDSKGDMLAFSELMNLHEEDRVIAFVSLLHLDSQERIWLEQEGHFEEIFVMLKKTLRLSASPISKNLNEVVDE